MGLGIIGTAVGTGYLLAGSSANSQSATFNTTSRTDYLHYRDLAKTDGERGIIALAIGGGLLAAGVIRFALHGSASDESAAQVSAWISPSGSGLALGGRF